MHYTNSLEGASCGLPVAASARACCTPWQFETTERDGNWRPWRRPITVGAGHPVTSWGHSHRCPYHGSRWEAGILDTDDAVLHAAVRVDNGNENSGRPVRLHSACCCSNFFSTSVVSNSFTLAIVGHWTQRSN